MPDVGGLHSRGDADLHFGIREGTAPVLKGSLIVRSIAGNLQDKLTPSFAPPGILIPGSKPVESPSAPGIFRDATLDLSINTDARLLQPTSSASPHGITGSADFPAQLQADLHLQGSVAAPRPTGMITARNATLMLPAGNFVIPDATLHLQEDGGRNLSAKAYGITRRGFCALDLGSDTEEVNPRVEGPPGISLPDMILALTEPLQPGYSATTPAQELAWIRQQQHPLPATGWAEAGMGETDLSSLGFYGRPWCWIRGSGEASLLNP